VCGLLRIAPPKAKGLFEEYFYGFLVGIFLALFILLKAAEWTLPPR